MIQMRNSPTTTSSSVRLEVRIVFLVSAVQQRVKDSSTNLHFLMSRCILAFQLGGFLSSTKSLSYIFHIHSKELSCFAMHTDEQGLRLGLWRDQQKCTLSTESLLRAWRSFIIAVSPLHCLAGGKKGNEPLHQWWNFRCWVEWREGAGMI